MAGVCIYLGMYDGQRRACWFLPFTTWTMGIELRSLGLVASTFICWAISLVRLRLLLIILMSPEIWSCKWQLFQSADPQQPPLAVYGVTFFGHYIFGSLLVRILGLQGSVMCNPGPPVPPLFPLFMCSFCSAGDWSQALPSPLTPSCSPPAFSQWFAYIKFWLRQQGLAIS